MRGREWAGSAERAKARERREELKPFVYPMFENPTHGNQQKGSINGLKLNHNRFCFCLLF